ncbi:MAG TPA: Tim44/TimA family putative adaptor protein [Rhizobiaceae bacterium]|nr:Tim44/TimA family putative adaptor protein [Rhizobiaceae bacterium]
MQGLDVSTVVFIIIAAVIFWQLRNVLGKRTGNERPPFDPFANRREASGDSVGNDNVVTLPKRGENRSENYKGIDKVAKPGTAANDGLRAVRDAMSDFDPQQFVDGAKMAYEMIVMAFADGDRKTLGNLLSREVYEGFAEAIEAREKAGEVVQSSFVGVNKCEIVQAGVKDAEAHVTLRIVSQMISATRDKDGKVIDGDPEAVAEVTDVWTFARDTRSRDPNWKLVATEAED